MGGDGGGDGPEGAVPAVLERVAAEGVRAVDFRFTDLTGRWRHTSTDAAGLGERLLRGGLLLDGSALPGWRDPSEPDVLLRPDPATAYLDPFAAQPTLVLLCDAAEPATGLAYERDPRSAARAAEAWLARQGFADRLEVAVEIEFFLFDGARIEAGPGRVAVELAGPELRPGPGGGAAPLAAPPADGAADIRAEMASLLAPLGFAGVRHEHGRAPHQSRFAFAGGGLVAAADRVQVFKDVARHVAASYGKAATFMARPLADHPGSAMALQLALFARDRPAFAGQGYADLSPLCLAFVAGVLRHARALNAFANPATNSYRRLRPGEEAPVHLAYAAYNRSAAIRIPFAARPEGKAVELRFPDPLANPYLALTAALMAGLDGVALGLEPGDAMDRNLYDLPPPELASLGTVAGSLPEALDALAAGRAFLARGEVVPDALVEAYLEVKRAEADRLARVPHPLEFELHFGA